MLLTGVLSPAAAEQEQTLHANVSLNVRWEIKEGKTINKGSYTLSMQGTLNLDPQSVQGQGGKALVPVALKYTADAMSGSYHYNETVIAKKPDCDDPALAKYSGGGVVSAAEGSVLNVSRMKHLAAPYLDKLSPSQRQYLAQLPGQNLLVDYYEFACGPCEHPTVPGRFQKSDCKYTDTKKTINPGSFALGFQIPAGGSMSGFRMWQADAAGGPPSFKVALSDLPEEMKWPAFKPPQSKGGCVTYSVTWSIGQAALNPLDVEVQKVFFHYDKQDQKRSIELWHHGPLPRRVEPPEWARGGHKEPAAFVRNYPFLVKAEFQSRRPVKAATIRAYETVTAGRGFGGELTQVGDLEIKGQTITGEFRIKEPQETIGTHKVTWQWEGDIEFKDEPGKIKALLGESDHTIYIVGGIPDPHARPYEYAVRKGCEWADGTKGDDETLVKIWGKFWNIPAPEDTGGTLSYGGHHEQAKVGTTNALLTNGEGICGAWADFFKDTVGVHGIYVYKVEIKPNAPYDLLVAREGLPCQGNPSHPQRVFTEHMLNAYGGYYYDPSYWFDIERDPHDYETWMFKGYCEEAAVQHHYENDLSDCSEIAENPAVSDDKDRKSIMENSLADCLIDLGGDRYNHPEYGCYPNNDKECEVYEVVH
ncbi:MAG: hypothetical protein JXA50_07150 [Deltaproteobacteria bacterium]|nr:hypothetical protein [Deltaproteobacteria bacterium]